MSSVVCLSLWLLFGSPIASCCTVYVPRARQVYEPVEVPTVFHPSSFRAPRKPRGARRQRTTRTSGSTSPRPHSSTRARSRSQTTPARVPEAFFGSFHRPASAAAAHGVTALTLGVNVGASRRPRPPASPLTTGLRRSGTPNLDESLRSTSTTFQRLSSPLPAAPAVNTFHRLHVDHVFNVERLPPGTKRGEGSKHNPGTQPQMPLIDTVRESLSTLADFRVELDLTSEALESMTFDSFVQAHSTDDKPYERPTTAASIGIPSTFPAGYAYHQHARKSEPPTATPQGSAGPFHSPPRPRSASPLQRQHLHQHPQPHAPQRQPQLMRAEEMQSRLDDRVGTPMRHTDNTPQPRRPDMDRLTPQRSGVARPSQRGATPSLRINIRRRSKDASGAEHHAGAEQAPRTDGTSDGVSAPERRGDIRLRPGPWHDNPDMVPDGLLESVGDLVRSQLKMATEQEKSRLDYRGALQSYHALTRILARSLFPHSPNLARAVVGLAAGQLHLFDCLLGTKGVISTTSATPQRPRSPGVKLTRRNSLRRRASMRRQGSARSVSSTGSAASDRRGSMGSPASQQHVPGSVSATRDAAELEKLRRENRIAAATKGGRVSWTSDGAEKELFDHVDEVELLLQEMEQHKAKQRSTVAQVGRLFSQFDTVARELVDPDTSEVGTQTSGTWQASTDYDQDSDNDGDDGEENKGHVRKKKVAKFMGFSSPAFFVDQVKRIRKQHRKSKVLPVGKLLDMIRHIWKEYFLAVKTSGRQRSLPRFCFEYFLTSYGLKTLAQQHLYVLLYSMKEYRPKLVHTRFETFLSFLGMTLPCSCTITPGGKCSCKARPPLDLSLQLPYALTLNLLIESLLSEGPRGAGTEASASESVAPVRPVRMTKVVDIYKTVWKVLSLGDVDSPEGTFAALQKATEKKTLLEGSLEAATSKDIAAFEAQSKLFARLASIGKPIKEVFKFIDEDESGVISPAEFRTGMKAMGFGLTEEELDLLSEIVDDDQSGAISYREFGRIFNKGKQLVVDVDVAAATVVQVLGDQLHTEEQRVIVAFQAADDDGNGMLTLDEFKSLISSLEGPGHSIDVLDVFQDALDIGAKLTPEAFIAAAKKHNIGGMRKEYDMSALTLSRPGSRVSTGRPSSNASLRAAASRRRNRPRKR